VKPLDIGRACNLRPFTSRPTFPPLRMERETPGSKTFVSRAAVVKRPFGVTAVAVLMCIGAALLALGSLGFFVLGGGAVTTGAGGPMSQLFSEMGTIGAGIFLVLAAAYATLAIYLLKLASWARLATIVFIALGSLFAVIGILASLPHPDFLVFAWQLLVIAVDVWIMWYLLRPHIKNAFAARRHHTGVCIEAQL